MNDIAAHAVTRPAQIRAVAATHFWYGATGLDLAHGLRICDWDIADVDLFDYFVKSDLKAMRIASRLFQPLIVKSVQSAILRSADEVDANAFLTIKGTFIERETLEALGRKGVFRVNFFPDFHFDHTGFDESLFHHYDLVTTTKSFQVDHLTKLLGPDRVAFLPHGYSPLVHRNSPITAETDYLWDISYIGNASPHKRDYLVEVARAFPDRTLLIVGSGWTKLAQGTPLEPFILGHGMTGDFFARIVERSRINLAIHFGSKTPGGWEDLISRRSFEIPAYRGFLLHVDNPEIRGLYDVPGEIAVFGSGQELVEQVGHYLARPDDRRTMIERAHARCVPEYSIHSRAKTLDTLVRARMGVTPLVS